MDRSLNDAAKTNHTVHRARTDRQDRETLDRASPGARSARGGPGGVALLVAVLLSGATLAAPALALETPVAAPETGKAEVTSTAAIPTAKPGVIAPGFTVKVGVVERAIDIDWSRARYADVALAAGGTRLAPGADAVIKSLAKDLALTGDKRERFLLIARAADPKPSAADLQLRARIVRNALIAAAGAPQDAIVVASWTGAGDPPGAPSPPGGAGSGLILAPIQATGDGAQTRALALDSAFAGIAELIPPGGVAATPRPPAPSSAPSTPSSPIATPTRPIAPSVAPPAAIATPRPPETPKPSVAAAAVPSANAKPAPAPRVSQGSASPTTPPKPNTPPPAATTATTPPAATAPQAKPATEAAAPSARAAATSALAALLPLPKARPAAPPAAAAPKAAAASSTPPKPTVTSTVARAVERPEAPERPRVTTPRPPVVKAEPPRRPPTRVAGCAPPRVILDDFYRGGPIIACDGSRR